ncbi:hypothetical protein [Aquimarina sediminis]|uniref:hypothetical protein n=1 Tax=Aquimarina sediminis TaxID=2070536 RepID=UPI000CA02F0B|nr:hypothetical protein [Aquimarina sediminis]
MKKWITLSLSIISISTLTAFTSTFDTNYYTINNLQSDEVTAVINKNTTEKELEDLKTFFSENDIELHIKKIEFNPQNEITSLSIILKKGNTKSQYSSSSQTPISEIELGYKNGNLYITNSGMFDITAWKNQSGFTYPQIDMDSIMKKHSFTFDFDHETDSLFFNGNLDVQKLKDQIMKSFSFQEGDHGDFFFNGQQVHPLQNSRTHKFNFVDSPNIEKLIIIDGKEADFNTLDNLAKSDKLAEVDFLKSETAVSIYGDKAKDGAIIATTKK